MTSAELVAYIGAAAWVPHIARWLYHALARPDVKIVLAPEFQIGYTDDGPVVQLTAGISSIRASALIDRIELRITHEKGDARNLIWKWMLNESAPFATGRGDVSTFPTYKVPVAVNADVNKLTERHIGFQDADYVHRFELLWIGYSEELSAVRSSTADPVGMLQNAVVFARIRDFFADEVYWKEGRYRAQLRLQQFNTQRLFHTEFRFSIGKPQMERLRLNVGQFDRAIRIRIGEPFAILPEWQWIQLRVEQERS